MLQNQKSSGGALQPALVPYTWVESNQNPGGGDKSMLDGWSVFVLVGTASQGLRLRVMVRD